MTTGDGDGLVQRCIGIAKETGEQCGLHISAPSGLCRWHDPDTPKQQYFRRDPTEFDARIAVLESERDQLLYGVRAIGEELKVLRARRASRIASPSSAPIKRRSDVDP